MSRAIKIGLPVLLLALGASYKLVLAKPAPHDGKVAGEVYVLPKDFVLNLAAGRFAKVSVALVLAAGHELPEEAGAAPAPEGYGALPEEALVRAIVTDTLTGTDSSALLDKHGRDASERRIEKRILASTDVKVDAVRLTDIAVQ